MEMPPQGRYDPYQWEGLSICQMHGVRGPDLIDELALTPRSEFEW